MATKRKDKDNGARAVKQILRKGLPKGIVGVFGDLAAQKHKDGDGATVGQIAAAHEFGAGVPERSWMRATIAERQSQIARGLAHVFAESVKAGPAYGERIARAEELTRQLMLVIAGWCQERVARGIAPELSADYLKRKLVKYPGASTPLIASGQLRQSITGSVEK